MGSEEGGVAAGFVANFALAVVGGKVNDSFS